MRIVKILILLFIFQSSLVAQIKSYSFHEVDSLPTFQNCIYVSNTSVDEWIDCFYIQVDALVQDSIESMEEIVGQNFEGNVKVNFDIDSTGKVFNVVIKNKPHPILKKGVRDVLSGLENLKPAKKKNKKVNINLTLEINHFPNGIPADSTVYSLKEIETRPILKSCSTKAVYEQEECNKKTLFHDFYKLFKYPAEARENGIEGTVKVSWIVEKDGSVTDVRLEEGLEGGCGEAVYEAYKTLESKQEVFIPAENNGEKVRCRFFCGVKFRLEDKETNQKNLIKLRWN